MVRKLEIDAISSDLVAVKKLLARRTEETDPIGFMQFSLRAQELEQQLIELEALPRTRASLAVFFGGAPVQGSKGIRADFAGKAVNLIQELVAKQFATLERGALAEVGRLPLRGNSDLLITDLARGSVGIVMEEAETNESLTTSELSVAVQHVAEDIAEASRVDATAFEELLDEVEPRYFASLTELFKLLDDSHATARFVEAEQDFELDLNAVRRGRERTEAAITDDDGTARYEGRLYLLPTQRKFELTQLGTGGAIYGNVSREFASSSLEQFGADNVVNHDWAVRMKVRTIYRPNRAPQIKYTLMGLLEELESINHAKRP
jgi:hypothetical protein